MTATRLVSVEALADLMAAAKAPVEGGEAPNECPHGKGLTCTDCDAEAEAEEATWD